MIRSIFRTDKTNVGDWFCSPLRFFPLGDHVTADIYDEPVIEPGDTVIVGGGGLISKNFAPYMERLARRDERPAKLIAWGLGESLNNDRTGRLVPPWTGPLPDYLKAFDLVGVRDFGTEYDWVPCASCMLDNFTQEYAVEHEMCIYEHKRIPIPIDCDVRRSNDGNDIDATVRFLASSELVITNSYHGAYWATLLGRRVVAIPNLSKMYRFRHQPVLCAPSEWHERAREAVPYRNALEECRAANVAFYQRVESLTRGSPEN